MRIQFTKMHGLGNDFVVLWQPPLEDAALSQFSRTYSDRRFGIGFDQALILWPSTNTDVRMDIYNADGSRVGMCGNGIRCVAKYIWDRGLSAKAELSIETPAGIMELRRRGDLIEVDMGVPVIGPPGLPSEKAGQGSPLISLEVEQHKFGVTCVSMGNPHAVIFVQDVSSYPVQHYGPLIESNTAFPKRTNVEFVQVEGPEAVLLRVWERGTGETLACGTGACAAVVASHLNGLTGRRVRVQLTGGVLHIDWSEKDQHVHMIGPAVEVFEGAVEFTP